MISHTNSTNHIQLELLDYIKSRPVINTHSHHLPDVEFDEFTLTKLLTNSYVDWCGIPLDETKEGRRDYLNKVHHNSYFIWLQKALQNIYQIHEPLTAKNWNEFSNKIQKAHRDNRYHLKILKRKCNYKKVILDAYWEPGNTNGHPEIFFPTYRVDMFFFGYSREESDHDGNNPWAIYDRNITDIDEYVHFMKEIITQKKQEGCIALKCAIAYDRGLNFTEVSKDTAQKAFGHNGQGATENDIKAFQDYVFFEVCKIAAELGLPLQCHTGLGQGKKTNAMQLQGIIEKNPDVKFVLFHCSYPWIGDVNALIHDLYNNVYPDLCWLPLISTSACQRALRELIEVASTDTVCWGCDTWTAEESYGALLALRYVLSSVLASKVENGYFSFSAAENVIDNILFNNACELYNIS